MLGVDEKAQIQALDRTAPILPMLPGTPERATHDYKRAGTSSIYAALDVTSGKVIGALHSRHRAIEFKKFLQTIDAESRPPHRPPCARQLLDAQDAGDHTRWLAAHPRFQLHSTLTSSSWLNLVERWFAELTSKKLRRGAHRSVRALNADIRTWIQTWNNSPRPFAWTKPLTRSSNRSPASARESTNHDTSRAHRLRAARRRALIATSSSRCAGAARACPAAAAILLPMTHWVLAAEASPREFGCNGYPMAPSRCRLR